MRGALAAAAVLLGIMAPLAQAAPPTLKARALKVSRDLAKPWPSHQWRNGSFKERLGTSRYGEAMLGYGLLQAGIRDHNRRWVRSGLRGVNASLRRRIPPDTRDFNVWAVAASYNLARTRLGHWPQARRSMAAWKGWLSNQYPTHLFEPYENKSLVDAVAVLEMRRSGIASELSSGGSVRAATRVLNRTIPAMASRFVLSDPAGGGNPIAYHALSTAMYARGVALLGRSASGRARAVLVGLVRTASLATAPDGDVALWGRSMAQKWTLTGLAAGEVMAARLRVSRASSDRRLHAVARRQLLRAARYGVGPAGEWIVPSLRQDFRAGRRGIDDYARTTEYTGLSLVFANWAAAASPRRRPAARIPADRRMAAEIGRGVGRQAVVRHGDIWFAARQHATNNLRYDFGLQGLKRYSRGVWQNVVPLRPLGFGSAGPTIVVRGRRYFASGRTMRLDARTGTVFMRGGFRRRGRWIRLGTAFRIAPGSCDTGDGRVPARGVSITAQARAGDTVRFLAFFRRIPEHRGTHGVWSTRRGRDKTRPLAQAVVFNRRIRRVRWRRGFHSAGDAHLVRGRFAVPVSEAGPVTMTLC